MAVTQGSPCRLAGCIDVAHPVRWRRTAHSGRAYGRCMSLPGPSTPALKATLQRYLTSHREVLLWKLEGLAERDQRWPVTASGTNLLGLVKHAAFTEAGYFGDCFARPMPDVPAWVADEPDEPNFDMYATADESPEEIVALYRRVIAHADATIDALDLDSPGHVPWWGAKGAVTLGDVLVHVSAETARHAGHADILRETLDGQLGLRAGTDNLPDVDAAWWPAYVARLRAIAEAAGRRP